MYKYVLFDLDGTLTDPKEGICKSAQYALHKMGIEEPNIDKLEPFIGPSLMYSFTTFYHMTDEDAKKAVEYYRERFSVVGLYENIPYDGIKNVLSDLKDNGIKCAVASAKPQVFVERIMEHFALAEYFEVQVGSELDGRRSEKSEIITEALRQLYFGSEPGEEDILTDERISETVMIGDRFYDVEGAKAVGCDCIAVEYGYAQKNELKKAKPTHIAKDVATLGRLLLEEKPIEKKYIEENDSSKKRKLEPITKQSLFKAVYVLVPFVLYYLISMATVSISSIIYSELDRRGVIAVTSFLRDNSWIFSGGVTALAVFISGLCMILFYHKTDKVKIKVEIDLIFAGLSGALLGIGVNMIFSYIFKLFPALVVTNEKETALPFFVGLIVYAIISPISEELLFRYMIFGRVKNWMGPGIAIFTSALFFGLYHSVVAQCIYAFLMGIVMAYIYVWTDNFLMPVIFHISANAAVYSLRLIPVSITDGIYGPVICMFTVLTGLAMALIIYKNNIAGATKK